MSETHTVTARRGPALTALLWVVGLGLLLAYPFLIGGEKYPIHVAITIFVILVFKPSGLFGQEWE